MKNLAYKVTAVAIATMALSPAAFAQNDNEDTGRAETTATRTEERRDDSPDMGWLGLLGLAGLAGLLKKPERQVVHQTEVRPTNTPTR